MAKDDQLPVMFDTSVWISAFRGSDSKLAARTMDLIVADRVRICGPVLFELRRGLRKSEQKKVLPLMDSVQSFDFQPDDWERAGNLDAGLRKKGITIPPMDVLISYVCLVEGVPLWTLDRHFKKVPNLVLYK